MNELEQLGRRIAYEQDALRERAREDTGVRHVRERLHALQLPARSTRRVPYAAWIAGAGLAAAAGLWLWLGAPGPRPLGVVVVGSGRTLSAGAWIEAPHSAALSLRFSDGTRVAMAPRARARLVEIDAKGAHLLLESGRARVAVVHRPHARWRVSAGPFAVHVTGTRFEVGWDPENDCFALDLTRGRVEVAGCLFGAQGYRMHAGQRLEASCKNRRFDVAEPGLEPAPSAPAMLQAAAPAQAAPARLPAAHGGLRAAANTPPRARVAARARRNVPRAAGPSWRALARQGRYAEALAVTDFEADCRHADARQLTTLADTARYAGAADKEELALRLLRQRFPGTPRAALAAYSLGRLEFDVHGGFSRAAEWFRTYLSERPQGALAREARGRLMEATLRSGDMDGARALARRYLHDYAQGPHATLARGLLETAAP